MKMKTIGKWAFLFVLLLSCNKHKDEWWLKGQVVNQLNGSSMSGVQVKAEVKKLQSGIYNDITTTADTDVTGSSGDFEMNWQRENISFCQLVATKFQYFDAVVEVSPDDMKPGEAFIQNLSLTPISQIQIDLASTDPTALVKLSVFSSDDYCSCNDESEYVITGVGDTIIQCVTGGGQWLKYQIQAFGSGGNVYHLDSVFCEPFIITNIQYSY
jgi:hypothetical protein